MSNLQFENLLSYGPREEDISKPLFCWMIAIINSGTGGQVFDVDEDLKQQLISYILRQLMKSYYFGDLLHVYVFYPLCL